jgi:hypothetical protein
MMDLKQFKLSAEKKVYKKDPQLDRRIKLLKNIERQIEMIYCEIDDLEFNGRKPHKWYWMGDDSHYRCSIYYGKQAIEIDKGKFSFIVDDLDEVKSTLEVVKECVVQGDFDKKVETISIEIRKNFIR